MTNSANGMQKEIKVKEVKLGTEIKFKYLGAVDSDDGFKPQILSKIAQGTAALTNLKPIRTDNNIYHKSKVNHMPPLSFPYFYMPLNHRP